MQVGASGARSGEQRSQGRVAQAAPVAEESSKSDKRRILIKRKRTDEAPSEEVASLPAVEAVGTSGAAVDTHIVSPPSVASPTLRSQPLRTLT